MKSKVVQIILIVICVSTFFIVKDINDSKNPFEKLDRYPDKIDYSSISKENKFYMISNSKDPSENRSEIIDYLKSLELKKVDGESKISHIASAFDYPSYTFEFFKEEKIDDGITKFTSDNVFLYYITLNEDKYLLRKEI